MELESVQLETSWNEAARVINENSQRIKTEIAKLNLGGGDSGGGATSMDELLDVELDSTAKGDILQNDGEKWVNISSDRLLINYYPKDEADRNFVNIDGDNMLDELSIQASDVQLTIIGQENDAGDYRAAIVAESTGEHYGGILWTSDTTNIEGASGKLQYNDEDLATEIELHDYVAKELSSYQTKTDASQTFVHKDGDYMSGSLVIESPDEYQLRIVGEEHEDSSLDKAAISAETSSYRFGEISWTRTRTEILGDGGSLHYNGSTIPSVEWVEDYVADSTYDRATIDEKINNIPTATSSNRIVRVFEKGGVICLSSSEEISSSTYIALARKLTQGWSSKQGWSVSRSFSSINDGGAMNETYEHHALTLQEWVTPNVQQPNGMYYYRIFLDGKLMTPDVLLEPFISSLHEQMSIYWGKRKKQVAFGLDTEEFIKRAATLRFGIAIGEKNPQIAPFKLVVQSKCYAASAEGGELDIVYLDETTWRRCVQFRV